MNMYRKSKANNMVNLFGEMNEILRAYYQMMEDCKDFPIYRRKIEEDLGQNMSMLAIMVEEADRDKAVGSSELYAKFDSDKQVFFK